MSDLDSLFHGLSDDALALVDEVARLEHRGASWLMSWIAACVGREIRRREGAADILVSEVPTDWRGEELDAAVETTWATGEALLSLRGDSVPRALQREVAHFFASLCGRLTTIVSRD